MTAYATRLALVCAQLNETDAAYAVVGASAMQLWGTTRATRDIDILIEPTIDNAARVLLALSRLGFGIAGELRPEDVASRTVTMIGDTPNVDVLTRAWNLRWEDARDRLAVFEVEGVQVPTVSIADLIESKRTGRTQDSADIEALEEIRRLRGL
ncbi:MAG: DUF6036 family nucleotidyltransferase [Gemmatimonadota bacterium]